jgi:hypothetical protein
MSKIPTWATFRGNRHRCESAKDAYVWLVERFVREHPEPFHELNWETEFVMKGKSRNYFARTPERLYWKSPHLAEDRNNFHQLPNGWYAALNLSNDEKLGILLRLATVAKLRLDVDWKWEPEASGDARVDLEGIFGKR